MGGKLQDEKYFQQLKLLNPKAYSSQRIRASVITEWLKIENMRQVQYMAGHKHISSVERYQANNIEELHNDLREFHPMR